MEKSFWSSVYVIIYCVGAEMDKHFDIHLRLIRPVYFPSKNGKDAVCKERNGGKVVYFPPESAYFLCKYYD